MPRTATPAIPGVEVTTPAPAGCEPILSADALRFVASLARRFEPTRRELLARRAARLQELEAGRLPDFLPETRALRERDWTVAPIPRDLLERKVEITGPVDRKMVINALNSGASVFMADFEDAHSPTWENTIRGQQNLVDAVHGTIAFTGPDNRRYTLNPRTAILMVRPRGWHLVEKHVLVDGQPVSASLCDFGLCFFHTASKLVERGTGPYWYLPKLESHLEARLWNDVFNFAQDALGLPRGTIRATVLIETIFAAFETDEILYELRDHSAGLNCGRWDYIFSFIKKFRSRPECLLPDRHRVTMDQPFLRAYAELVIKTCHRRGIHAGWPRRSPSSTTPPRTPPRWRESDRTSCARYGRATTGPGSLIRRSCPWPARSSTRMWRARIRSACGARTSGSRRATCSRCRTARSPRPGSSPTSTSASATSLRGWAAKVACRFTT